MVLVTVDGARWQDVFGEGDVIAPAALPELTRWAREEGARVGAPSEGTISASGPHFVSLPGYAELLTGRAGACRDNECDGVPSATLLDEVDAAGGRAALVGSWEKLGRVASSRGEGGAPFPVSAGRGGDPHIAPAPGSGDFRPDRLTADVALDVLEHERPDLLFLGLGDTDEHAHHGDRAGYGRALRFADDVLARLRRVLARMGERGASTVVIVTADHGRSVRFTDHGGHAPESGRVWLVALGAGIAARGDVRSPAPRTLSDVAPTIRRLMGLSDRPSSGAPLVELLAREETPPASQR